MPNTMQVGVTEDQGRSRTEAATSQWPEDQSGREPKAVEDLNINAKLLQEHTREPT